MKEVPDIEEYHRHLAITYHELARVHYRQDEFEKAIKQAKKGLEIRRRNRDINPTRTDHSFEMAMSYELIGMIQKKTEDHESR